MGNGFQKRLRSWISFRCCCARCRQRRLSGRLKGAAARPGLRQVARPESLRSSPAPEITPADPFLTFSKIRQQQQRTEARGRRRERAWNIAYKQLSGKCGSTKRWAFGRLGAAARDSGSSNLIGLFQESLAKVHRKTRRCSEIIKKKKKRYLECESCNPALAAKERRFSDCASILMAFRDQWLNAAFHHLHLSAN